jgi:RNA polymerase sigma-70 factor, ECF subfamily
MKMPDDTELIERTKTGDADALALLVERHYGSIYSIAYKWCGDRNDAEDIAQNVCMKLGRAVTGFKARAAFSSWLYRVTLNAVRDFQRSNARHSRRMDAMAVVSDRSTPPAQETDTQHNELWACVKSLPAKQRDAVLLIFSEGLNHAEAASIMGCAESTVSWHIHKAKKKLKVLLES